MRCARRADATEVIGHALAAKSSRVGVPGHRRHAGPAGLHRAPRVAPRAEHHARWLYQRAVAHCTRIDRELLIRPAAQPTLLGHALNLLAGVALRYRELFGYPDPPWSVIGAFSHGHLLAPSLRT